LLKGLALCEKGATDERNFVRKSVSWALRSIGQRNKALQRGDVEGGGAARGDGRPDRALHRQGGAARPQESESEAQVKQGIRKDGDFCWINMITPQPKEAMAFFGEVLGWTYFDMGGIGHGIRVGESQVGGLFDKDAPQTPPGTKAHIGVMVKVRDVDATVEKVKALGGEARPAFDIFDAGRMAVCHDPNGAAFDPWQPKSLKGFDVNSNAHGAPSWFESLTTDPVRAAAFYSRLFNWQSEVMKTPDGDYTTFKLGTTSSRGS
jgi:predicted enzyme related to lactoylglutathione lyase